MRKRRLKKWVKIALIIIGLSTLCVLWLISENKTIKPYNKCMATFNNKDYCLKQFY